MRILAAAAAAALVMIGAAEARTWRIRPGAEAEQQLQTALIEARPGDTVQLGRGRFELTTGLSLDVDRVTIRGEGEQRSVLSFTGQRRGAEGLLITSDQVTLRDFAVENARGDAIKARFHTEATIFQGDERAASTIVLQDGKRAVGTKASRSTSVRRERGTSATVSLPSPNSSLKGA